MGQQYSPHKFFRQVGVPLLRKYFEGKKLLKQLDWGKIEAGEVELLALAVDELLPEPRRGVEADFTLVTELAHDGGSILIREEADAMKTLWGSRLDAMKNDYERAFLVLLEDRSLLEFLVGCGEMDRFSAARWSRREVGKGLRPRRDEKSLAEFQRALSEIFRPQGRGRVCHIDVNERRNPARVCYFAYPEDFARTELGYDERNRFARQTRRTALETIFVYRPETGLVEMAAAGSLAHKEAMARAFCAKILGLDDVPPALDRPPFDLASLKSRGFVFATDPGDNIDRVEVRRLRLELPGMGRKRIVVSAKSSGPHQHSVHDVLDLAIDRDRMPLSAMDVTQAELSMRFRPPGGGRAKTVTFEVTTPDRCNLKDSGYDLIAKKYLARWGIARA